MLVLGLQTPAVLLQDVATRDLFLFAIVHSSHVTKVNGAVVDSPTQVQVLVSSFKGSFG